MNSFAGTPRIYFFPTGEKSNCQEPSATAQANGFAPTYINIDGVLVPGDRFSVAELNYIFRDIYQQIAAIDAAATAQGL